MANLNSDKFESYIISKGFDYSETKSYDSFIVLYYRKKGKLISKGINQNSSKTMRNVFYETSSKEEYAFLKNNFRQSGFVFIKSEERPNLGDNTLYHIYSKGNIEVEFYTADRSSYLGYCIGVEIK